MATNTYVALDKVTLTNSTTTYIEFLNISQSYTDLLIVFDGTATSATAYPTLNVGNNSYDTANNYSRTLLTGNGTSAGSSRDSSQPNITVAEILTTGRTNLFINFMNYSNTTTNKTFLIKNNNASNKTEAAVGLWRSTSAINRIKLETYAGTFTSGSTFSLYGIKAWANETSTKATGGYVSSDATYFYHTFPFSGTFTPNQAITCDYLVVAGGGGGGYDTGGGGGAGGLRSTVTATGGGGTLESALSLTAQAYTVTIGAGGVGALTGARHGASGSDSTLSTITSTGGGGGGDASSGGYSGGSGGGNRNSGSGGAPTSGQGYVGGNGGHTSAGSGGGGAGQVGANTTATNIGGVGGNGVQITALAYPTATGASNGYYAGGGGGGSNALSPKVGGLGGGGQGGTPGGLNITSGAVGTGSGGGGAGGGDSTGFGNGASGIVIVRYAK